jgi:hypothetical protein
MNATHDSELRAGNRALNYLVAHYSPMDAKLQSLTVLLPKFSSVLYHNALEGAQTLLRNHTANPLIRFARGIAGAVSGATTKETELANCIFDLQLTVFFTELTKYLNNNEVASILGDALLYQATGCEASSPTEDELVFAGTQNRRGIQKFQDARKSMPDIPAIEAWIFGKEYSVIISGAPARATQVMSVGPFSLGVRVRARWHIRRLIYGTPPTKDDEQALVRDIKQQEAIVQRWIDAFLKSQ